MVASYIQLQLVAKALKSRPFILQGGSLEYFVYGGGVHPIILGKKLLCYPILMGS